jgi:Porin subfamily
MPPSLRRSSALVFLAAGAFGGPCQAQTADSKIERAQNQCAAFGPGFVAVEGTQTCVRVGGHVRVEMGVERPMGFDRPSPLATPNASWSFYADPPRVEGIPTGLQVQGQQGD